MTDPFEQFKDKMEPLPNPHAQPVSPFMSDDRRIYFYRPCYERVVPKEIREQLGAVSADLDEETIRRVKKVNEQIEDWKKRRE